MVQVEQTVIMPETSDRRRAREWRGRRRQVLKMLEEGISAKDIAKEMDVTPAVVRHWIQRMYNDAGIPIGSRGYGLLMKTAYKKGWLRCPCPGHDRSSR